MSCNTKDSVMKSVTTVHPLQTSVKGRGTATTAAPSNENNHFSKKQGGKNDLHKT